MMMMEETTIPFDEEMMGGTTLEHRDGWLLVRIHVPELNVSKCLQFPADRLVWDVKQQVLASLPKDLKESFNYGLFCPPSNGRAGKFLDEERRLGDYPFNGPVGYLELKYKRRVYKMLNLDEKQLKALHTRANLRRFLEYVNNGQVEKVSKMCTKGLDPNFHCQETNETPLTLAVGIKKPNKLLIALVNGGAILDYRAKDGSTALHRSVEKNSLEAVTTLLELGASPNYRDVRGITPVYLSVTKKADPKITESLLHDHATLGVQDSQGWQEVHQACRNGLVHHLEHLLFYGADMNGRNASGNTPLHVCAVNNQEACARMLLFRGAQRGSLNYANQTPYQVAVIAGNLELAEMIQNYKAEDIVPFRGPPRYNPKRRSGLGWTTGLGGGMVSSATMHTLTRIGIGPPSPCPSEHPFSSASSSLSEGSSSHRSHEDDISIVTDKSLGDTSDIISDSSGVGTSSDSTACSIGHPNTTVVCMIPYSKNYPGHLSIQPGDVIEVFGSTDCGLLEGQVRGTNRTGLFPIQYVQEVNFRQKNIINVSTPNTNNQQYIEDVLNHRHQQLQQQQQDKQSEYNNLNNILSMNNNNHVQFSTAPRIKKVNLNEPRTVSLHRAKRGFGFVLRGAKATSPLMQLKPSERCPALQYLDDVDPNGVADMSGLKPGDYLLAINNEDVRAASHEHVVDLIRRSGALVTLTVLSPGFGDANGNSLFPGVVVGGGTSSARQCATLPRRIMQNGKLPAPVPPQRDPKTTLSVGRARAKSMVAGLECGNENEKDENDLSGTTKSSSAESIHNQSNSTTPTQGGTPVPLRTASIKARPTSSRITATELEELFQRQQGENSDRYSSMMTSSKFQSGGDSNSVTPQVSPQKGPLVYSSVADMKRKKSKNGTLRGKPCEIPSVGGGELKRTFHSTPDLAAGSAGWNHSFKNHHSQDDVHNYRGSLQRLNLPPPNHPPPPPPEQQGHLVKVDVSSEYESTTNLQKMRSAATSEVMSSFKPASNAKLYASPQDIRSVAFRNRMDKQRRKTTQVTSLTSDYAQPQGIPEVQRSPMQQQPPPINSQAAPQPTSQPIPPPPPMAAPPIPDPDYSLSESETEDDKVQQTKKPTPPPQPVNSSDQQPQHKQQQPLTNGNLQGSSTIYKSSNGVSVNNSNASQPAVLNKQPAGQHEKQIDANGGATASANNGGNGSANGNSAMLHSFSVFEIQKMRNNLKSSKSYPNDLLSQQKEEEEVDKPSAVKEATTAIQQGQATSISTSTDVLNNNNQVQVNEPVKNIVIQQKTTAMPVKSEETCINPLAKKSVNFALKPMVEPEMEKRIVDVSPKPVQKYILRSTKSNGDDDDDEEIDLDAVDLDDLDDADSPSPPPMEFQRHNSMTRKQATALAMQRAMQIQRPVVSLVQLPPPLETELESNSMPGGGGGSMPPAMKPLQATNVKTHYQVHSHIAHSHPIHHHHHHQQQLGNFMTNRQHNNPIQVQFHAGGGGSPENIVLAPPPQFSDVVEESHHAHQHHHHHHQQQNLRAGQNVRIVGAVPKTNRF